MSPEVFTVKRETLPRGKGEQLKHITVRNQSGVQVNMTAWIDDGDTIDDVATVRFKKPLRPEFDQDYIDVWFAEDDEKGGVRISADGTIRVL